MDARSLSPPGILLEVGNNGPESAGISETEAVAVISKRSDATRHFRYWLLLRHDGGDGLPRRRTPPKAPLEIQEQAALLDSETVSQLRVASEERCESGETVGASQAG